MGALEPYVAAAFVGALRPLAGGRGAGPLALLRAVRGGAVCPLAVLGRPARRAIWPRCSRCVGSPMLVLWAIVPRGGYIELLAWALPVLGVYRASTRPGRRRPRARRQAAWGFLLAFGYFLNPLSLIVYLTLALDWTFGRHGADLRRERGLGRRLARLAPGARSSGSALGGGAAAGAGGLLSRRAASRRRQVALRLPPRLAARTAWGTALGALGRRRRLLGGAAWWSGLGGRIVAAADGAHLVRRSGRSLAPGRRSSLHGVLRLARGDPLRPLAADLDPGALGHRRQPPRRRPGAGHA